MAADPSEQPLCASRRVDLTTQFLPDKLTERERERERERELTVRELSERERETRAATSTRMYTREKAQPENLAEERAGEMNREQRGRVGRGPCQYTHVQSVSI